MRIGVVGGSSYVEQELIDFLTALRAKYPDAVIVTGSAMRSCEPKVRELAHGLGFDTHVPEPRHEYFGDLAMECQVNDILSEATVIVTVGSPTGGRAKLAAAIHKRVHGWRETPIPFHNVAAPKTEKKAPVRKATKKVERD